jgi:hypothetical protein
MSYAPWVDKAYARSLDERLKMLGTVTAGFSKFGKKAAELARQMEDLEDFEKTSFLTHLHIVRLDESHPGLVEHVKFSSPVYAAKHKTLPMVIAIADRWAPFREHGKLVKFEDSAKGLGIKQVLSWTRVVSAMKSAEKQKLAQLTIDGIRAQKSGEYPVWLSDMIEAGKEFEIVGFAGNAPYINVDKTFGDTKPVWVHPWGIPALLLRHRQFPAMMIVSPTIRLNENIRGERNMEGYTG